MGMAFQGSSTPPTEASARRCSSTPVRCVRAQDVKYGIAGRQCPVADCVKRMDHRQIKCVSGDRIIFPAVGRDLQEQRRGSDVL
jgi:hypothetical protein